MSESIQSQLVREMEANLRHGDNYRGVGWTKSQAHTDRRYQVMLDLVPAAETCTLLDVGCGAAHFLEFLRGRGSGHIEYSGLDLSKAYLSLCRRKFPDVAFYDEDLLASQHSVPRHDYLVLNGLFNYKGSVGFDEMWGYCQQMLLRAAALSRKAFAFNVMSKQVDWERGDLFHLPFDLLCNFLSSNIGRRFTIRHDYGLFEYTTYVYMEPLPETDDGEPANTIGVR